MRAAARPESAPAPAAIAALRRSLGARFSDELANLFQESDAELRLEGLLSLAQGWERQSRFGDSAALYQFIAQTEGPTPWVDRARRRLEALAGRGPLRERLEGLARRFVAQACDPAMLAAFGLAGGVASLVRASAGSWLAVQGASWWTRGLGARALSGSFGYLAEVPSFVAARRAWSGPGEGAPTWSEEMRSAGIFLGVMQLTGFAGASLAGRWRLEPAAGRMWNGGLGVGGVYLAHRAEEALGLCAPRGEAERWIDTADTWLQMQVGARLLHGLVDTPSLELRRESLLRLGAWESVAPGPTRPLELFHRAEQTPLAAAFMNRGDNTGGMDLTADPHLQALASAWGPELARPGALRAVKRIGLELGALPQVAELLGKTSLRDPERLEVSLRRLAFLLEHSRPLGARGNYLEWLARHAFTAALRQNSGDDRLNPMHLTSVLHVDNLLDRLYAGGDLNRLEELLLPLFPQYQMKPLRRNRLQAIRQTVQGWLPFSNLPQRIEGLPHLGTPARDTLLQMSQHAGLLPKTDPLWVDMRQVMNAFERAMRDRDDLIPDIERAIAAAAVSPLGYARLFRLYRVLARELYVYPKILELAAPGIRLQGYRDRPQNPQAAETVDMSQANGFYEEPAMAENFAEFFRNLPRYSDPAEMRRRTERRRAVLRGLWPSPRPLEAADLVKSLEALGDPISTAAAADFRRGAVSLEILDSEAFNAEVDRYVKNGAGRSFDATMIPGRNGERNRILLRQLNAPASPEVFPDFVFRRLGLVVHEHEHHLHTDPDVERHSIEITRQEMRATHREIHWYAEHGDAAWLDRFHAEGSAGWAMALRSFVEGVYLIYKNPED